MADFFGNLLMRSGASHVGAILQPRLPALFESTQGADELPAPQADALIREVAPAYDSTFAEPAKPKDIAATAREEQRESLELPKHPATKKTGKPGALSTPELPQLPAHISQIIPATRAPEENVHLPQDQLPERSAIKKADQPGALSTLEQPRLPAQTGQRTPTTAMPDEKPAHPSAAIAQSLQPQTQPKPGSIVSARIPKEDRLLFDRQTPQVEPGPGARASIEQGPIFRAEPAAETGSAPARESGNMPQAGKSRINARQATGQVLQSISNGARQGAVESSSPGEAESLSPIRDASVRRVLKAMALPAQPVSTPASREPETLVQVHIGRIDVRAVPPPTIAPPPTRSASAQPKMSLEDYLRQREEKR